jgi:hypothetical protein
MHELIQARARQLRLTERHSAHRRLRVDGQDQATTSRSAGAARHQGLMSQLLATAPREIDVDIAAVPGGGRTRRPTNDHRPRRASCMSASQPWGEERQNDLMSVVLRDDGRPSSFPVTKATAGWTMDRVKGSRSSWPARKHLERVKATPPERRRPRSS